MKTISTIDELKNAIILAEDKQSVSAKMLREQLHATLAPLRSGNHFINTIKEVVSIPGLGKLVAYTAFGLTTGFLSKRILSGTAAIVVRYIPPLILKFIAARSASKKPFPRSLLADVFNQLSK